MRKLQYAAFAVVTAGVLAALAAMAFATGPAKGDQQGSVPKETREIVKAISAVRHPSGSIHTLVGFGTRHTLSSQTDPNRGIGAATQWVFDQFQQIAALSGGRMTVEKQTLRPAAGAAHSDTDGDHQRDRDPARVTTRVGRPDLPGQRPPRLPLHRRARLHVRRAREPATTAPASRAVLEMARAMATHEFDATIKFVAFSGEEQGTFGSVFYAAQAKAAGDEHRRDVLERHHRLARSARTASATGRTCGSSRRARPPNETPAAGGDPADDGR